MIYSKNELLITTRVIVLMLFISAAIVSIYETDLIVTPLMFAIFSLVSMVELIWYLQSQKRSMTRFLLSIKHHDFSRHYKNDLAYKGLHEAYDLITQSFENLEAQKHADHRLLQTVSEHIKIGLVCYLPSGEVVFSNRKIKEMLNMVSFAKLTSLLPKHQYIHKHLASKEPISSILVEGKQGQKLLLKMESFTLRGASYKLASLYDIKSVLDTNELESYQKLLRVITHEIMNSATPILSLIQVVNKKLINQNQILSLSDKDQKNIAISLNAIEAQTAGILKFVEAYRKINKEISPVIETTLIETIINRVVALVIDQSKVDSTFTNLVTQEILVDPNLISQALINLLKNAMEAIHEVKNPEISITTKQIDEQLSITVEDNGSGIAPENISKIFVPFFTTKGTGSGVGLALSRKIINAHKGSLTCHITPENKTLFSIVLSKGVFK